MLSTTDKWNCLYDWLYSEAGVWLVATCWAIDATGDEAVEDLAPELTAILRDFNLPYTMQNCRLLFLAAYGRAYWNDANRNRIVEMRIA